MRTISKPSKQPRFVAALTASVALALVGAGCGTGDADVERGRQLFIQKCASCHAMTEAGSTSQIGPNMDRAFGAARNAGMDADTVEGIVAAQIEYPRPSVEDSPVISMPAGLVEGTDVADVAAYVAEYAGVEGVRPPPFEFPDYFVSSCGGCHILESAGSQGVTGPNLDEVLPGQEAAMIENSIVNPGDELSPGYGNLMPNTFGASLQPAQLDELVQYLVANAGGGGAAAGGGSGPGG